MANNGKKLRLSQSEYFKIYKEVTGGKNPIGLTVPFGYPKGVKERGGVIEVYEECIRKGITWEELLNYKMPEGVKI